MNSPWKTAAAAVLLLIFFCVGCAHIVMPDWFIKRSGVRKGGDLLTEWNRIGFRVAGAIFAGFTVYFITSINPDPDDLHWQFATGTKVQCERRTMADGQRKLVAIEELSN